MLHNWHELCINIAGKLNLAEISLVLYKCLQDQNFLHKYHPSLVPTSKAPSEEKTGLGAVGSVNGFVNGFGAWTLGCRTFAGGTFWRWGLRLPVIEVHGQAKVKGLLCADVGALAGHVACPAQAANSGH